MTTGTKILYGIVIGTIVVSVLHRVITGAASWAMAVVAAASAVGLASLAGLCRRAWRTYQYDRAWNAARHDELLRSGHYGKPRNRRVW